MLESGLYRDGRPAHGPCLVPLAAAAPIKARGSRSESFRSGDEGVGAGVAA